MPLGYVAVIAAMLIWGSVSIFARLAGQEPLVTVTYRVLFAAAALAVVEAIRWASRGPRAVAEAPAEVAVPTRPRWRRVGLLLLSGLALAANWLFFFQAVGSTSVSNAVLSYYTAPIWVALLAPLLLKERFEGRTGWAMALAFAGVVVMLYQPGQPLSVADLAGIGYGLIAALFYAAVTITGRWLGDLPATRLVLIQTGVAGAVLLAVTQLTPSLAGLMSGVTPRALALLLVVGMVHTALALVLYFYGLKRVKVQHVGVLAYLDPVSAILFAFLFLAEWPGTASLAGGALVLAGSALLLRRTA